MVRAWSGAVLAAALAMGCSGSSSGTSTSGGSSGGSTGSGGTTGGGAVNFTPTHAQAKISTTYDPTNNTYPVTMVKVQLADFAIDCAHFEDAAPPSLDSHSLAVEVDQGQGSTTNLTAAAYPVVAAGQGSSSNYAYATLNYHAGVYLSVTGGSVTFTALDKNQAVGSYAFDVSDGTASHSVSGSIQPTVCP